MSYATPADFRKWFMQKRLDRYLPGVESAANAIMQSALNVASAEMDGAFQLGGYTLPLATTGALAAERAELLKLLCMALALEPIRLSLDAMPENLRDQVETARRRLAEIRGMRGMRRDGTIGFLAALQDLPGLTRAV